MTVRFGVAGTGYWAREVHVVGLTRTPGAQLMGVWGRNATDARTIADRHGVEAFATFGEMLEAVDAISFALPPDVQAPLALEAARAGRHLLLEKPVAKSSKASSAIAAEAQRRGLATLVFFMRRFIPQVEHALEDAVRTQWSGATIRIHSSALTEGSPYAGSVWRQQPDGALWDIGPHVLSILIPVLGAVRDVAPKDAQSPFCEFQTVHDGGARADVSLTLHARRDAALNHYRFESASSQLTLPDPPLDRPALYSKAARELVANIVDGASRHRCDVDFGDEIVRVLEAIDQSLSTGKRIALATTVPAKR